MAIIEFTDVSKSFLIEIERAHSFQEMMVNLLRRRRDAQPEEYWALKNVSFQVEPGEGFALIGANGSGKSTALKLMSKIIDPTSGSITVNGRIAALLELGAGFHLDLNGRENIYLNGSILGLKHADIRRHFDDIVAFAELERFIDTPVRNYSSGMQMRLGFSIATAFQPDILLIDEVLAVGDQAFQSRCMQRIGDIQSQGATIVLVSHDLSSVQKLCRRSIWLHAGAVRADGKTADVINKYMEHMWSQEQTRKDEQDRLAAEKAEETGGDESVTESLDSRRSRWGSGEVRIERAELLDLDGAPTRVFHTGDKMVVRMWYNATKPVKQPAFGVSIYDEQGNRLNGPNTIWSGTHRTSIRIWACRLYHREPASADRKLRVDRRRLRQLYCSPI